MPVEEALDLARHVLLLGTAIVCGCSDLARGKVYNFITLPALFLGLALSIVQDGLQPGNRHLLGSGLAVALAGGLFGIVYLMRGIGAGDLKMTVALGAIAADWRLALLAAFYGALLGAVVGVGFLIWRGRLGPGLKRSARLLISFGRRPGAGELTVEETFPYGLAIAAGTFWAWIEIYLVAVSRAAAA